MGLVVTTSATNGEWIYLTGTIAEVLNELADQNLQAKNVVFWTDDATDAKALACRFS